MRGMLPVVSRSPPVVPLYHKYVAAALASPLRVPYRRVSLLSSGVAMMPLGGPPALCDVPVVLADGYLKGGSPPAQGAGLGDDNWAVWLQPERASVELRRAETSCRPSPGASKRRRMLRWKPRRLNWWSGARKRAWSSLFRQRSRDLTWVVICARVGGVANVEKTWGDRSDRSDH